jgi:type III secretion protein J
MVRAFRTFARRFESALALALALGGATGCAVPVAAALEEADANRVVVALDQAGIDSAKETDPQAEGRFRVNVPRDDVARALAAMREEELPRPKARGVLDAVDRGQLVPSQAAEHAQLALGLAGELEKTLGGVDGVLAARVHLNLPSREPLRDGPPQKGTASVLVEHRGTTPPLAPESIQRLVAGGAPGVAPADVAVVLVPRTTRAAARTDLGHVGPITVARGSMTMLKAVLAGLAVVIAALSAAMLALWSKVSRIRRERELEATASARGPLLGTAPTASGVPGPVPRSIHPAAMSAKNP